MTDLPDGFREGFAAVNDQTLHYVAAGDPDKPLVLMAHGFPDYWRTWEKLMDALKGDYFCVAPDQRGYHLSSKPEDVAAYYPKHLIQDLVALAASFKGEGAKFTLIAHDWGGAIAWALALKHPELLDRLIIINAAHPGAYQREMNNNPDQGEAAQYILDLRAPDAEEVFGANDFEKLGAFLAPLVEGGHMTEQDKAGYHAAWSEPGALTGMFNWYRAMRLSPSRGEGEAAKGTNEAYDEEALRVHVPCRVIWGLADDALLPGCVDHLQDFVEDLDVVRVPHGTHWVHHEEPELAADAVKKWLQE